MTVFASFCLGNDIRDTATSICPGHRGHEYYPKTRGLLSMPRRVYGFVFMHWMPLDRAKTRKKVLESFPCCLMKSGQDHLGYFVRFRGISSVRHDKDSWLCVFGWPCLAGPIMQAGSGSPQPPKRRTEEDDGYNSWTDDQEDSSHKKQWDNDEDDPTQDKGKKRMG